MGTKVAKEISQHPHVTRIGEVCGGSPIIKGTRIRVVDIAIEYERLGYSPDEIIDAHPHLTLPQVHDALSYYYENREELDRKMVKDKRFIERLKKDIHQN